MDEGDELVNGANMRSHVPLVAPGFQYTDRAPESAPIYRMSGIDYIYDELVDALNAEDASLPPETWRDGVWNLNDYMIEAMQVGIIERVDAHA
jgi:hypothetical protein